MYKSKLLAYLKALNADELVQLNHFIKSPYFFNGRLPTLAIQLFAYLRPLHPEFPPQKVQKERVFKHLHPQQTFDKKRIELMMSKLFKVVEHFIVHHFKDVAGLEYHLVLTQFFREREMYHYFDLSIKKMRKQQEEKVRRGDEFFRHQFMINREVMLKESARNLRSSDLNLPSLHQQLDAYYLSNKLDYACHLLAQDKHHLPVEVGDSMKMLNHLKPLFEEGFLKEVPLIALYTEAFLWLADEQAPSANFVQSLRESSAAIPIDQLKTIHALYRNYCIRRYNENEKEYLPYLFEIYCLGLEEGILFNNGGLLQSTLQNMVSLGLKLKKYDWVYQFLETYKDKIVDSNVPHEIYANNLACYYFELKSFNKALDCLAQDYEDTYYKIAAKLIEIKIYYEQKQDLLEYKMQAFKLYIYRSSNALLPEVHKEGFKHFIDLLKQICHPSTFNNGKRIEKLMSKLTSHKILAERAWLKEKLEELK